MKRPYFLLLLAVVAAGVFVFWQSPGSRAVTAVMPRRAQAVELVYATGVIEPVNQTAISTQSAGELAALLVDEGASIEAGQALARLDSTTAQQKVDELAAKLAWDEKELERAKALRPRRAGRCREPHGADPRAA